MSDQQNINSTFINNQTQNSNPLNRKQFEKLKRAKKSLLVAGIFATVWFVCFVIFIILINVAVTSTADATLQNLQNPTYVSQSFTDTGAWVIGLVFIGIGACMVLGCITFGILALINIFSVSKEIDSASNNEMSISSGYSPYNIISSLSYLKYFSLVGLLLCPVYIGVILIWLANVRLAHLIRNASSNFK